jgi:hypothetical protein
VAFVYVDEILTDALEVPLAVVSLAVHQLEEEYEEMVFFLGVH